MKAMRTVHWNNTVADSQPGAEYIRELAAAATVPLRPTGVPGGAKPEGQQLRRQAARTRRLIALWLVYTPLGRLSTR